MVLQKTRLRQRKRLVAPVTRSDNRALAESRPKYPLEPPEPRVRDRRQGRLYDLEGLTHP
jgi:hypothetical protein